jgi:hypothetical protein
VEPENFSINQHIVCGISLKNKVYFIIQYYVNKNEIKKRPRSVYIIFCTLQQVEYVGRPGLALIKEFVIFFIICDVLIV